MKQYLLVFLLFAIHSITKAQTPVVNSKDTTIFSKESDSIKLKYPFKNDQTGNLFLSDPSQTEIIYDSELKKYIIIEKIGDYQIKRPIYMSPEAYEKYKLQKDMAQSFKNKVSATNSKKEGSIDAQKNLLPSYYVKSDFFETIFGGNTIEVNPQGYVLVKMGMLYQKVDNPQLSERNRSSFTFDFDQEISASIQAKVGTRLKVGAQYDTQSTFNFQNQIKLEYTPTEDDILQKIEVGNVSMPIKNSLIVGAQSLFGVKAQMQFGKTTVTGVFAEQKSQTRSVAAEGGSTIQEFELQATDYDENRHFFLSQYFRDNYNLALKDYPLINSSVNITKIEVWVTNRNATTTDVRNIVALSDIGEGNPINIGPANVVPVPGSQFPSNTANNISSILTLSDPVRSISTVGNGLVPFSMQQGRDYSVLENAIKLRPDEYTLHPQLGFISLNRRLNDGEVLAVAYEYTVAGNVTDATGAPINQNSFKVGEFSNDGIQAPNNLAVKLLRSEILTTKRDDRNGGLEQFPTWRLMMKNVYALGAFPLSQDGFRFEVQYRDDATGIPSNTLQNAQTPEIANKPLLQVLRLDQLDQSQFRDADGYFDYVEGITVNSQNGFIFFPEPEPFGGNLEGQLTSQEDKDNYVFKELYLDITFEFYNNPVCKEKDDICDAIAAVAYESMVSKMSVRLPRSRATDLGGRIR